ncbi:hypothetical protein ACFQZZ_24060 [Nocardia sp. GCM10030253]|uniref:hypothetical protein n=1 Tax=Nocardia sp. GCM10030253 TaxID=3273404 RepID=UPI00363AB0C2
MSTQDPGSANSGDRRKSGEPDQTPAGPSPTQPAPPDASPQDETPTLAEYSEPSEAAEQGSAGSQSDAPAPQPPTLAEYSEPTPTEPGTAPPQWDVPTLAEYSGPEPTVPVPPRPGSIQRQEPGITQPRPPTVAEARARDKARKRAEEEQRAAVVAAESKKRTRKRVLIGGVAIVGVAGLVGGGYLAYRALTKPDQVTAYCTQIDQNGKEVVVDDDLCNKASASSGGGHSGLNGIFIYNGSQYRYYYGGTNSVGKPPTGGTTIQPKGAEIKTKSGTSIQRGGLGSSSKSGSGS